MGQQESTFLGLIRELTDVIEAYREITKQLSKLKDTLNINEKQMGQQELVVGKEYEWIYDNIVYNGKYVMTIGKFHVFECRRCKDSDPIPVVGKDCIKFTPIESAEEELRVILNDHDPFRYKGCIHMVNDILAWHNKHKEK